MLQRKVILERRNFFRALLDIEEIKGLLNITGKRHAESLAHLCSSRQLPAGDRKALARALRTLQENLTTDFVWSGNDQDTVYKAAKLVGSRCREAGPGPLSAAHISLSYAGSFFATTSEGGRSNELLKAIRPILTHIPEEDESIILPWTTLRCPAKEERWRHWCRAEPYLGFPERGFGDLSRETLGGFEVFRQGFDDAIGAQILACAYLSYEAAQYDLEQGIPVRALSIPEPGFKTRIVTTGPYWLNVLQQGTAHVTRAFLESHPSAKSGLVRTDQAWQFLYMLARACKFPEGSACLSSDLKEATDNIPHQVALCILDGFQAGLGYLSPLYDLAVRLVTSPRLIINPDGSCYKTCRGVLMGEPLTKTILTIYNIVCEEIAIREYLGYDYTKPVQVPWRCFVVAGDDHLAVGPKAYLDGITRVHIRLGSKISPDKHAVSSRYVMYCEKVLEVYNFWNFKDVRGINNSTASYESSPFVDSVKIRLLSPCSKSIEVANDRNIAIGKAKTLGRTLRWLNRDHFSMKWVSMVRDRFFTRMGSLLPERSSGVYWHLLLPEYLGGLGLWVDGDEVDLAYRLPDPSKGLIKDILSESISPEKLGLFKGFTSNMSYRGYQLVEDEVNLVKDLLKEMILPSLTAMKWSEAKKLIPGYQDMSAKDLAIRLNRRKILMLSEIEDHILRAFLFKEILSEEVKTAPYNTERLKRRYARLWDIVFDGHTAVTADEVREVLSWRPAEPLYDVSETNTYPIRGEIREVTILDECLIGLPELTIKWSDIGELT